MRTFFCTFLPDFEVWKKNEFVWFFFPFQPNVDCFVQNECSFLMKIWFFFSFIMLIGLSFIFPTTNHSYRLQSLNLISDSYSYTEMHSLNEEENILKVMHSAQCAQKECKIKDKWIAKNALLFDLWSMCVSNRGKCGKSWINRNPFERWF